MAHELTHVRNRDTLVMTTDRDTGRCLFPCSPIFGFFFGGRGRNNPLGAVAAIAMMILAPLAAMLVPNGDQPHPRI